MMAQQKGRDEEHERWLDLIRRYYDGCSLGDVELMQSTLHPEVVHWFLAPNLGSTAVMGREHLARYWRKVATARRASWIIDRLVADGDEAVIEWTMFSQPEGSESRVATRGAEWFERDGGLIREIRSYYQLRDTTTELDGFPYDQRGYSVLGREESQLHGRAGGAGR